MKLTHEHWLLALVMMAILPGNSYGNELPHPLQMNHRRASFIHRLSKSPHKRLDPPSKKISQLARSPATRIEMSTSQVPSSSQRTSPSPWSPGKWKIMLDFGKEASDSSEANNNSQLSNLLGEDWGADGGRLLLSFEVLANAETNTRDNVDNSVQMTWLGGKPTGTVECIPKKASNNDEDYCASYINKKGQQHVQIASGQWRIEPPLPLLPSYTKILSGQASTLRFYLTLLTSIERNTISFPKDQLLLLQSNTFRTEQYSAGVQTVLPYKYAMDVRQEQLEEQLNHETGDRRLDGNDIFETLGGYKDIAELVMERDEKRRKWKDVEGSLPKLDSSINTGRRVEISSLLEDENRWGIWPGDTELMTIERGAILAVVAKESKQKMGLFPWMQDGGGLEETVIVGKWSVLPIFDDDLN